MTKTTPNLQSLVSPSSDSDSDESTKNPLEPSDVIDDEVEDMEDEEDDLSALQSDASLNGEAVRDLFNVEGAQQEEDSELMMSLNSSTLAHLWAMVGLILLVNISFCLYRVCQVDSKVRYVSDSDHYDPPVPEDLEFQD